ncbi:MAG TPA: hypothetical protein VFY06_15985 [Verrucomicrobiae bacterium]|nr:hypothetical protein [Verrucomicrobiae bacterium]
MSSAPASSAPAESKLRDIRKLAALQLRPDLKPHPSMEYFEGAGFLSVRRRSGRGIVCKPPPRGEIKEFSRASRRRFIDTHAKLRDDAESKFCTLTYPDNFGPYVDHTKEFLHVLVKRLRRRWPDAAGTWKLEFLPRRSGEHKGEVAPHIHMNAYNIPEFFPFQEEHKQNFIVRLKQLASGEAMWEAHIFCPPGGQARCRYQSHYQNVEAEFCDGRECFAYLAALKGWPVMEECSDGTVVGHQDNIRQWLSRQWYDIVNSGDAAHYWAGTGVDCLPSEIARRYMVKRYMTKPGEDLALPCKPGRFWGVFNRAKLPWGNRVVKELTDPQSFKMRRVVRRFREARGYRGRNPNLRDDEFSVKLYCKVDALVPHLPQLIGIECEREASCPVRAED